MSKNHKKKLNEYGNAYVFNIKKQFSEPKIYNAGGDLSKRWYVYYSYRSPRTGKLERQAPIYKGVNLYKTKRERMEILSAIRLALKRLLQQGYTPYEDAKETERRLFGNKQSQKEHYTVKEALAFALEQRKPLWAEKSKPTMISHYNKFIKWLKEQRLLHIDIQDLRKRNVSHFLNSLQKASKNKNTVPEKVSPKTKNNYRATLSSLFSQLENDEIIDYNFVTAISKVKSIPKKNKPFSPKQIKDIITYLDEHDPYLRVFIQFITYAFLRNIEVCRIRVGDIDLEEKRLYVGSKTEPQAIVPIIKGLYTVIQTMKLQNYKETDFLITRLETPGVWEAKEASKTDHFSDRFAKVKKALGFGNEYTLYSFRHTAAINIYRSSFKVFGNKEQTLSYMMSITRHKSKSGLENYLREIGATLPKDYSDKYTIEF